VGGEYPNSKLALHPLEKRLGRGRTLRLQKRSQPIHQLGQKSEICKKGSVFEGTFSGDKREEGRIAAEKRSRRKSAH
jgi:hypothetical protein